MRLRQGRERARRDLLTACAPPPELRKELKHIVDSTSSVANRSKVRGRLCTSEPAPTRNALPSTQATLMGLKKQTDAMKSDPEREGEMRSAPPARRHRAEAS